MTGIIDSYIRYELDRAGYPNLKDVRWDTSYCQGSGMAAYGDLTKEDALAAVARLELGAVVNAEVEKLYADDGRVEVQCMGGGSYNHAYTMKPVIESWSNDALDRLCAAVKDELSSISIRLHKDAEAIDRAGRGQNASWSGKDDDYVSIIDEFTHNDGVLGQSFVRVSTIGDRENFDPFEAGEPDEDVEEVREIIGGKTQYGRIEVEVFSFTGDAKVDKKIHHRGLGRVICKTEPLTWPAGSTQDILAIAAECVVEDELAPEAVTDLVADALKERIAELTQAAAPKGP